MAALNLILPIGLGLLFAAVHYWSGMIHAFAGKWTAQLRSALAGITIAYLFLQLYPQSILAGEAAGYDIGTVFLWIAGGLLTMLLLEHLAKKSAPSIRFTVIQLSIGMLLVMLFSFNALQGWLFLGLALLLSTITALSLGTMPAAANAKLRLAFASTTLLGILAAALLPIPVAWLLLLQAVLAGAFTTIALRTMLDQLQSAFFIAGIAVGTAVMFVL